MGGPGSGRPTLAKQAADKKARKGYSKRLVSNKDPKNARYCIAKVISRYSSCPAGPNRTDLLGPPCYGKVPAFRGWGDDGSENRRVKVCISTRIQRFFHLKKGRSLRRELADEIKTDDLVAYLENKYKKKSWLQSYSGVLKILDQEGSQRPLFPRAR